MKKLNGNGNIPGISAKVDEIIDRMEQMTEIGKANNTGARLAALEEALRRAGIPLPAAAAADAPRTEVGG